MPTSQGYSSSVPTVLSSDGFTYPNGSCVLTAQASSDDPAALLQKRFLLRIPMWIFSAFCLYIAVMVILITWRRAHSGEVEERNVVILRYGLLIASIVTTINLWYFSFAIYVELNQVMSCSSWYKLENALYWSNISVIYTVLWFRQRVVYKQRTLREAVSKVTSFFSNAVVVMVVFLPVSTATTFSVVMMYCFDDIDLLCRPVIKTETIYFVILTVAELSVPVILPLTLLGLFAWPMIRYHVRSKGSGHLAGQRSLIFMLWRICVATFLCLATDVGAMLCNERCALYVAPTMRHFSLFSNLLCLVFSFAEWRKILFPMVPEKWEIRSNSRTVQTPVSSTH